MSLPELRKKIDALDERLLALLNERADLAHEVGVEKRSHKVEIYAPEREEQVLRSLAERNRALGGRLPEGAIRAIYREIMSASLALETDMKIAYCGPEATDAYQAAREKFGSSVLYMPRASIAEVFGAVAAGEADYGVVPIENATDGIIVPTLEMFRESLLRVCAQISLRGTHRFLVIGQTPSPPTGSDGTSLLFSLPDEPGALVRALEPFHRRSISMTKFESRLSTRQPGEYYFFVEADGHAQEPPLQTALAELEGRCAFLKVLGTYPRHSVKNR